MPVLRRLLPEFGFHAMPARDMERRLLSGLLEWVSLPVPNYEYFCESHESSSRPFAGYRKLPGIADDTSKMVDRQRVAGQLEIFLARLHSYPVDKAREAGVPEERDLVVHWRDKSREQLRRLDGLNVNPGLLRRYLENDTPVSFEGAASLVHYTGKLDAEVISRSRYLATCLAIHNITLGRDLGRIQWVEAGYAALQLVFAT